LVINYYLNSISPYFRDIALSRSKTNSLSPMKRSCSNFLVKLTTQKVEPLRFFSVKTARSYSFSIFVTIHNVMTDKRHIMTVAELNNSAKMGHFQQNEATWIGVVLTSAHGYFRVFTVQAWQKVTTVFKVVVAYNDTIWSDLCRRMMQKNQSGMIGDNRSVWTFSEYFCRIGFVPDCARLTVLHQSNQIQVNYWNMRTGENFGDRRALTLRTLSC